MGYSYATLDWLDALDIPAGGRVLDLGSQDLYLNSEVEAERAVQFVAKRGGVSPAIQHYPHVGPVGEIWVRAGFHYQCVDIDDRPATVRVDLQSLRFPRYLKEAFDLVVNAGTTEHLSNPVGGFAFLHFACRPGGLIAHDVPLFGFGNHGLVNPTPKYWKNLHLLNGYEIINAEARRVLEGSSNALPFYHESLDFIDGLRSARDLSWMLRIAYRKTHRSAFIPPFDADGLSPSALSALVRGSLAPLSKNWSRREINDAMDLVVYRRPTLARRLGRSIVKRLRLQGF